MLQNFENPRVRGAVIALFFVTAVLGVVASTFYFQPWSLTKIAGVIFAYMLVVMVTSSIIIAGFYSRDTEAKMKQAEGLSYLALVVGVVIAVCLKQHVYVLPNSHYIETEKGELLFADEDDFMNIFFLKEGTFKLVQTPVFKKDQTIPSNVQGWAVHVSYTVKVGDVRWYTQHKNFDLEKFVESTIQFNEETYPYFKSKRLLKYYLCTLGTNKGVFVRDKPCPIKVTESTVRTLKN
ncbi:MAG: hypothetical protein VX154_02445 [Pseudomonadota bacterium]|nr:hypothetical protein [Pseudomonadota bacterium]